MFSAHVLSNWGRFLGLLVFCLFAHTFLSCCSLSSLSQHTWDKHMTISGNALVFSKLKNWGSNPIWEPEENWSYLIIFFGGMKGLTSVGLRCIWWVYRDGKLQSEKEAPDLKLPFYFSTEMDIQINGPCLWERRAPLLTDSISSPNTLIQLVDVMWYFLGKQM